MADIHIRNVDDELFRRLKVQAATEGITLKDLVLRKLGFTEPADKLKPSPKPTASERPQHDPKTCRIYNCLNPACQKRK